MSLAGSLSSPPFLFQLLFFGPPRSVHAFTPVLPPGTAKPLLLLRLLFSIFFLRPRPGASFCGKSRHVPSSPSLRFFFFSGLTSDSLRVPCRFFQLLLVARTLSAVSDLVLNCARCSLVRPVRKQFLLGSFFRTPPTPAYIWVLSQSSFVSITTAISPQENPRLTLQAAIPPCGSPYRGGVCRFGHSLSAVESW